MRRMKGMEERMKEVELSLRNVKLLLREKDAQLKEQVTSTGSTGTMGMGAGWTGTYLSGYM